MLVELKVCGQILRDTEGGFCHHPLQMVNKYFPCFLGDAQLLKTSTESHCHIKYLVLFLFPCLINCVKRIGTILCATSNSEDVNSMIS